MNIFNTNRPSQDPLSYPYNYNNSEFGNQSNQSYRPVESSIPVPTKYVNSSTAKSYAYELQLASDRQILQRSQQQSQISQGSNNRYQISNVIQPIYQEVIHEDQPVKVISRSDIEDPWRLKCTMLEKQIYELQQENNKYRGLNIQTEKVTYFEDTGRVNQLSQEVDRLNQVVLDLNNEIDSWRLRYQSLETQLRTRASVEQEIERMRRAVQDNENVMQVEMNRLREQIDEWQKRYTQLESNSTSLQNNQLKNKNNDQIILQLQSELKKAELTLRAKSEDYETLQQKFNRMERVVRDSEYQTQETTNLRKIIDERNKEIEALKKLQANPIGSTKDLDSKIALYRGECERLGQIILAKDSEIQIYKDQLKRQSQFSNRGTH